MEAIQNQVGDSKDTLVGTEVAVELLPALNLVLSTGHFVNEGADLFEPEVNSLGDGLGRIASEEEVVILATSGEEEQANLSLGDILHLIDVDPIKELQVFCLHSLLNQLARLVHGILPALLLKVDLVPRKDCIGIFSLLLSQAAPLTWKVKIVLL